MLKLSPNESTSAGVDDDHSQWVIQIGDPSCEVTIDGNPIALQRYDLVRVEPGSSRTIRKTSDRTCEVLLVTQSRETISASMIEALKSAPSHH